MGFEHIFVGETAKELNQQDELSNNNTVSVTITWSGMGDESSLDCYTTIAPINQLTDWNEQMASLQTWNVTNLLNSIIFHWDRS